jgi:rhamnulokinase
MSRSAKFLAFDLGAESGRALLGRIEKEKLSLEEVHRFPNRPVQTLDHLNWDVLRLFEEIKQGLAECARKNGNDLDGIGLNTWGVDSALLDARGELLGNPYCYRDQRTGGMMEKVFAKMPKKEIFELTGIQFMPLNTLYQLYATFDGSPRTLELAETLFMMPDLFNYWLTGIKGCERTDASTTQFFEARSRAWSRTIFERLGLPFRILPDLILPGTVLGPLLPSVASAVGLKDVTVITPACHDTACAVAAVPMGARPSVYISSGTWSALGAEIPDPVITDASLEYNFTNESSASGQYMFRKNIMGLWLLQECRRTWAEGGSSYDYGELVDLATRAVPFGAMVEPDHESFLQPGDMPTRIVEFCRDTGQSSPEDEGAFVRCILESLALKYRWVLDKLEESLNMRAEIVHIVGGGSRNRLLCQLTANATGRPVLSGPDEAATSGNILMQAKAKGYLASLEEGIDLIKNSFELIEYQPEETQRWELFYSQFLKMKESSTTLL